MQVLILNGSPRLNGNTSHALNIIAQGIINNSSNIVEVIDIVRLNVGGCIACDACRENDGNCIMDDDSKHIVNKISHADVIIFGTPVYWWGVSAQLKAVIDKCYSKDAELQTQTKQVGIVSVGANPLTDKQYKLISEQFGCICDHLGWKIIVDLSFSAWNPGDLQKSEPATMQLAQIWKKLEPSSI